MPTVCLEYQMGCVQEFWSSAGNLFLFNDVQTFCHGKTFWNSETWRKTAGSGSSVWLFTSPSLLVSLDVSLIVLIVFSSGARALHGGSRQGARCARCARCVKIKMSQNIINNTSIYVIYVKMSKLFSDCQQQIKSLRRLS